MISQQQGMLDQVVASATRLAALAHALRQSTARTARSVPPETSACFALAVQVEVRLMLKAVEFLQPAEAPPSQAPAPERAKAAPRARQASRLAKGR